jgi:GNAT superfamily N-acetyltransferase
VTGPELRPIAGGDLAGCVGVFYDALEDLQDRRGAPRWPRSEPAMERLFARLAATHPAGAWLAEDVGRPVGFGIAVERERLWFLSFLFVLPAYQAAGLGRRLLERALPAVGPVAWQARGGVLATCVEAAQPVSTGLYADHGLLPRMPLFLMTGIPAAGALRTLPAGIEAAAFPALEAAGEGAVLAAALDDLDLGALGHRRAADHRDDRAEGRQGWLYRERGTGRAVGYGYVQPSGRVGPLVAADGALVEGLVGHLMGTLAPPGAWQLVVPGPSAALPALLRAGLRLDGSPGLLSATGPYFAAERYLLRSFALP